jgi:hypothetical protein
MCTCTPAHPPVQRIVGPHDVGGDEAGAAQLPRAEPAAVLVLVHLGVLLRPEPKALGCPTAAATAAAGALFADQPAARPWPAAAAAVAAAAAAAAGGGARLEEGQAGRGQEEEEEQEQGDGEEGRAEPLPAPSCSPQHHGRLRLCV